jgi:glycosyltransferase involved in cell wall biosynthesis
MKQNLLIIGPIDDIGGRELETGFIANTFQDSFKVKILSTINHTSKSQIYDFVSSEQVNQLDKVIYKKKTWFKLLAIISYLKASCKQSVLNYVNNNLAKKTGYRAFALSLIKQTIDNCDLIIICAQISSNYVREIVEYASTRDKPIVLRTSNTIKISDVEHNHWLDKVNLYVHHSLSNAQRLSSIKPYNYILIDQCTFKEEVMLKIKPVTKFKTLLYIGRLSPEKGINELIDFFKNNKTGLKLRIIGDGNLFNEVHNKCSELKNVHLFGFLNQEEIISHIKESDAIIIPSHEESGPLVGLEAMASARIVISTKVGAMLDRLKGCENQFWFDIDNSESLKSVLDTIKSFNSQKIESIAEENRNRYVEKYKMANIKSQYKNAIFNLLNQSS